MAKLDGGLQAVLYAVCCTIPLLILLPCAMIYVGIAGPSDMCECSVNQIECQTTIMANLFASATTSTFNATNMTNGTITLTNMTNGTDNVGIWTNETHIMQPNGTEIRKRTLVFFGKKQFKNPAARNFTTIRPSTTANPFVTIQSGDTIPVADIVNRRSTIISVREWLIIAGVLMIVFHMGICIAFVNTVAAWCTAFFMIIPFYIWCILGIKIWQALQGTCADANLQLYTEFFAPNGWVKGISIAFVSVLSFCLLGCCCALFGALANAPPPGKATADAVENTV